MAYLPKAVPFPERYSPKQKPTVGSEVIHRQLVEVLQHRASASGITEVAESSPTSSYGTAPEQKSEAQTSSLEEFEVNHATHPPRDRSPERKFTERPPPILVSSSLLRDVPDSHKPATSQAQEVPAYPMNKQNVKPYEIWVNTKGVPLKYYSFAYLAHDQTEYVQALQDSWDKTSMPPIRPEAPLGTTLHKSLNSHCLETMERIPPGQAWKMSNNHCINSIRHWEKAFSEKNCDPGSPEAIDRDSSIQRCRELREELLAQRSNVEEMVSTKILLARAVWEHEAFKQIKKERSHVKELEAELVKVKDEKLAAQNALLDEVEKLKRKSDADNLNAFVQMLGNESKENAAVLLDWAQLNEGLSDPKQRPANPLKLTQAFAMLPRLVTYIEKRRSVLQQEMALLSRFVDVRPIKNDKANLIAVTMETFVHDTLKAKVDIDLKLEALRDQIASWSTATSPGIAGMPLPPPGAAHDDREDLEKRIETLEVESSSKEYEWAAALTFSRYWKIYCPYKTAKGESMDLSDDEEEEYDDEEEQEYNDDSDYEEDPCAKLTEAKLAIAAEDGVSCVPLPTTSARVTNIESPSGAYTARTMQWLYDVMAHACQAWTEDVVRHRDALQKKQRENDKYEKTLLKATTMLKEKNYQNSQAGKVNQNLRKQVRELETRIDEYIQFMRKIGIESDKDLGSKECLYNSIQSLKALKDENLRSKALIDGLNERVADLTRTLDLCEEAMVPWPSANRLDESLAESLQVYDHMFSNHKFWLRNLDKSAEDSSLDNEEISPHPSTDSTETTTIPSIIHDPDIGNTDIFIDGFAMLNAMASGTPIPDLEARMTASRHTSPERRKPPGPYDEHSLRELEISEKVNVSKAWRARGGGRLPGDDQLSMEIEAMSGLVELREGRNTKFVERFEEGGVETRVGKE